MLQLGASRRGGGTLLRRRRCCRLLGWLAHCVVVGAARSEVSQDSKLGSIRESRKQGRIHAQFQTAAGAGAQPSTAGTCDRRAGSFQILRLAWISSSKEQSGLQRRITSGAGGHVRCPVVNVRDGLLIDLCTALNDGHRFREQSPRGRRNQHGQHCMGSLDALWQP